MTGPDLLYVALGDSMSIDDYAGGRGRGAASLLWRNCDHAFPEWRSRDLATRFPSSTLQMLARDGATSGGVLHDQLPRVTRPAALATVTMGGNDLMLAYGDDQAAAAGLRELAGHADQVLSRLRSVAGDTARIVVATIYDPSDGTGDPGRTGLPPWPSGLAWLHRYNQTLHAAAARHGALVADVHTRFLGHGMTAGDITQADPEPGNRDLWYCGIIEPNAWGASEIRAAFWAAIEAAAP